MKIIAIEGLDKSGKKTQTDLLFDYLITKGLKVVKSEFHRYDTPTGRIIMDYLKGRYDCDDETIELIMAADKQAQQKWFNGLEERGVDVLILDRYTTSQMVYSKSKSVDTLWVDKLLNYVRLPDYEIIIDISPETSMVRKGKYGKNDRYESNYKLLSEIRENYLKHAYERDKCLLISEADDLSIYDIHKKISKGVDLFLGL